MAVKILITRCIDQEMAGVLYPLIAELRTLAMNQPGYIQGETLKRVDRPNEYLVISTWRNLDDWERWNASEERIELQGKIDDITCAPTQYTAYVSYG